MKKKFIGIMTAMFCAAAVCSSAYAVTAEDFAACLNPDWGLTIDAKAILQVYIADLHDLVNTGKLTFTETQDDGIWQEYVADAFDKDGNYAGNIYFASDGTANAAWNKYSSSAGCSINLLLNQKRIETLLAASGYDASNAEYKLARIEGFGYAFYVNNGIDEALVYANLRGGYDGLLLCDENLVAIVNDEFIERAAAKLDHKSTEFPDYDLSKLWSNGGAPKTGGTVGGGSGTPLSSGADENPPEGGGGENSSTTGVDDNNPMGGDEDRPTGSDGNPLTGGMFVIGKTVFAAALAALGVGAVVIGKKRGR